MQPQKTSADLRRRDHVSSATVSCAITYRHLSPGRGVRSGIDLTPPAQERTLKEDTPIVVVLHGLTGGATFPPDFGAYQCSYLPGRLP